MTWRATADVRVHLRESDHLVQIGRVRVRARHAEEIRTGCTRGAAEGLGWVSPSLRHVVDHGQRFQSTDQQDEEER